MSDTGHLKTNLHEFVKQYVVYDGSGRTTHIYETREDAEHGSPCMLTQYTYDGASNRIQKRKETVSAWDSAWDM